MLRSYLLFFIRLTRYYLFCISTSFGFVNHYLSKVNWLCFYMFHNSFFCIVFFFLASPNEAIRLFASLLLFFPWMYSPSSLLVFFFCIFFVFRLIIERKRERARKADSRKRNIWFEKTNDKYRRRIVLGFVFRLLLCGYVLFLFILHMFPSFAFYLSSSCLLICVRD